MEEAETEWRIECNEKYQKLRKQFRDKIVEFKGKYKKL